MQKRQKQSKMIVSTDKYGIFLKCKFPHIYSKKPLNKLIVRNEGACEVIRGKLIDTLSRSYTTKLPFHSDTLDRRQDNSCFTMILFNNKNKKFSHPHIMMICSTSKVKVINQWNTK